MSLSTPSKNEQVKTGDPSEGSKERGDSEAGLLWKSKETDMEFSEEEIGRFSKIIWYFDGTDIIKIMVVDYCARIGDLGSLRWMAEVGEYCDRFTMDQACEGGHLEIVRWLEGSGCERFPHAIATAFRHRHRQLVEWLKIKGYSWRDSRSPSGASRLTLEARERRRAKYEAEFGPL